ncbi:MAG: GMC family oxidoreductase [Bacteroidetes bacterium]|nr:GMC family oxidoreductase [Bacteroidota bacterium]
MYIDARELENGSLIEGDICIIGAGAAGISMALQYINTPYKIILLEGGGFDYDDKVQELYVGKITGQPYYPLKSARLHYFGGTTGHWAGMCTTFDAIDFTKRSWVEHSGWPIKREDLDPFYERAHKIVEIGPYNYSLDYWLKQNPAFVPLPLDSNVVWSKMWQFSPPTRFGKKYKDVIVNAKNIHLYTYANAVEIRGNENVSSITSVTVKNYAGKTHTVKAKYFILACCAIQNTRLLLSSNKQAKAGIGNDNDLVGRFFMEHLEINSAELWLHKPDPLKLYMLNTLARAELAIHPKKQEEFQMLNGTASLSVLETAKKRHPAIETWSKEDPRESLNNLHESDNNAMKKSFYGKINQLISPDASAYQLFTRIEQAPNPSSRVMLDTEKDYLGVPKPILHWVLTPQEKRSIRMLYKLIGQQVGLAGIGRIRMMEYLQDENDDSWPSFTGGGWHHMGTTRMSDDPKKGVVDANCKIHGVDNLFVAGSSCYATGAAVNPTLTVIALSLRLSDHVLYRMKTDKLLSHA